MGSEGWIALHRQIMDSDMYFCEPFTLMSAWIDLLLIANHKTRCIRKRGIQVEIKRGRIGYSERVLAERWQWSRGKVRRFLQELIADKQIDRETVPKNSKLTSLLYIRNYDHYQFGGTTNGTKDSTKNNNDNKKTLVRFDLFYKSYPKHTGKKQAQKAWVKNPDLSDGLFDTIMQALERQKATIWKGKDLQYIPYPATWLNGERWTDEIPKGKKEGWV